MKVDFQVGTNVIHKVGESIISVMMLDMPLLNYIDKDHTLIKSLLNFGKKLLIDSGVILM